MPEAFKVHLEITLSVRPSILMNVRNDIYLGARLTEDSYAQMYNKFNNSLQRKLTFAI